MAEVPPVPKGGTVPKGTSGSYGSFRATIPNAKSPGMSSGLGGQSGTYNKAVATVFRQQGAAQKAAIIKGALANPNLPSSKIVLSIAKQNQAARANPGGLWGDVTKAVSKGVGTALHDVQNSQQYANSATEGTGSKSPFLFPVQAAAAAPGTMVSPKIAANTAKDAINLPAEVMSSVAIPAKDLLHGNWKAAADSFIKPYEELFQHPGQMLTQHPLDSYLMAAGLAHPGLRAIESGARTIAGKGAVDVARPPVHVTANMNIERPDFALNPIYRAGQKTADQLKFSKTGEGTVKANSPNAEARLIKLRVSRIVNGGELIRRSNRNAQVVEHMGSVLKNRAARAAHSAKTALKYNPQPALIPGANVLRLIAEGVIRKPSTVAQDLETHLQAVAGRRADLLDLPAELKAHDKYVKTIRAALNDKGFLNNPGPAFKAAVKYRKDMAPLVREAHRNGHYGDLPLDALHRRAAMPAVLTHMPGARYDKTLGMVRDTPDGTKKLTTDEMRQFVRQQTGRDPAYVPHGADRGNSAFFVSQARRPAKAPEGTTMFNFQHGLADPSHEALLKQRVHLQGVVDAHRHLNEVAHETEIVQPGGKGWSSFAEAERAARDFNPDKPGQLVPIKRISRGFPGNSLEKALDGVDLATIDEEAQHRALDYTSRLKDDGAKGPGAWALIDSRVAKELKGHENNVNLDPAMRFLRGSNNQFRTVALATSFRHLPGVMQENLIRSVASGVGPVSYFAGRQVLRAAKNIDPRVGHEREIQFTGGQQTGQALRLQTHGVAQHYEGTALHGPLAAWEKAVKAPGLRQATNLWHSWAHFMLGSTKKMLEEQAQVAAIGKHTINDFGGRHGLLAAATGQWGQMIDQAAHGILDKQTAQRFQNTVEKIYGRWTDLTPGEQRALMFSPFGMWWVNSVKWLYHLPVDHPILSGALAANNVGTQKQRSAQGMDLFAPNALPSYLQGGIPLGGGKTLESNYYSPFGVANDPFSTAMSLMEPWQVPVFAGAAGKNWLLENIKSPGNPTGNNKQSFSQQAAQDATVILNSLASSFIPLYTKAQTVVQGGASSYDTSTLFSPQTKGKNPGLLAGLRAATNPAKIGKIPGAATAPTGKSSGGSINLPSVNIPSVNLPSVNLPG